MPGEVNIEIRRELRPTLMDRLLGTVWSWQVLEVRGMAPVSLKDGWGYTEKQARRRAERVARALAGRVQYRYNPTGLPGGKQGK